MELREYRKFFAATSLSLMLVAVSPVLSMVVSIPTGRESFSELWILGPDHKADDYPFSVGINKTQDSLYVAVRNHMGYSVYYMIYVKLRNQTQPSANRTTPSSLDSIYEFRFFLADRGLWETPFLFSFQGKPSLIDGFLTNGYSLDVSYSSSWDSNRIGFYYQLFFELWLYNGTSHCFEYNNRFVGIWLNMTGS